MNKILSHSGDHLQLHQPWRATCPDLPCQKCGSFEGLLNHWFSIFHGRLNLPKKLGGGFKYFLFSPLLGEDSQFDEHIFQMGWFNHQPESLRLQKVFFFFPSVRRTEMTGHEVRVFFLRKAGGISGWWENPFFLDLKKCFVFLGREHKGGGRLFWSFFLRNTFLQHWISILRWMDEQRKSPYSPRVKGLGHWNSLAIGLWQVPFLTHFLHFLPPYHDCQYKKEYFLTFKQRIVEVGIWSSQRSETKVVIGKSQRNPSHQVEPAKSFLLRVWQSMAGVFSPKHFHCNHDLELLASIWYLGTSWAIKRKVQLFWVYRGWNPTQLYGDYNKPL